MRLLSYCPPTRFVDHMHSEHEVKHEPEVILAVSVSYLDFVCGPCDLKGTRLSFESSQDLVTFLSYCLSLLSCQFSVSGVNPTRKTVPHQDCSCQVCFLSIPLGSSSYSGQRMVLEQAYEFEL